MSTGFFFLPQPMHLRFRIRTGFGILRDVSTRIDRQSISFSWDLDSLITQGSFTLSVPVGEDDYDIDVWREVRVDDNSLMFSTRNERYFRGFILTLGTWEENGTKYYQCKVVDGNIFFQKSPNMVTTPVEYSEEDVPWTDEYFVSNTAAGCLPGIDYDTSTINLHHTWTDPELFEPLILQNMTFGEAIKAIQEYMFRNTPPEEPIPQALITWGRDEGPGDDDDLSWRWKINWFTWEEIDTFVVKLTDDNAESALAAHYYSFRRTRQGAQMINRQYVVGFDWETGEPIEHVANDTTSQGYYGIILSGKPIVSEEAATLEEVQAVGESELAKWSSALETIDSLKVLYPFILGSPAKIQIKNENEGGLGDYTEYILSGCAMSVDSAGLPVFDLNLGATFPVIGERGFGWRGGARFNRDVVPPRISHWHDDPADDVLSNVYEPETHTTRQRVAWKPNTDHDIRDYFIRTRIDGLGTPNQNYPPIPHSAAPYFELGGLPANEPGGEDHYIEYSVRGRDSHGNIQPVWSDWRAVIFADRDYPAAPISFMVTSTGIGRSGPYANLVWSEGGDPHAAHDIWYWPLTNIYDIRRIRFSHAEVPANALRISQGLVLFEDYGFQIRSVTEWGDEGPWSSVVVETIDPATPNPPTGLGLNTSVNGTGYGWDAQGAYIGILWTPPTPAPDHYHVVVSDLTGPITYILKDFPYIPGGWTGMLIQGLPRAVLLTYEVTSVDQYGQESTPATFTYTIPNEVPAAPTGLSITSSGTSIKNGVETGWAVLTYTPSTYPGAEHWARAERSGGSWKKEYLVGNPTTSEFRLTSLPINVPLLISMRVKSIWGPYWGSYTSTVSLTITHIGRDTPPAFEMIIEGDDLPEWTTASSSGSPSAPTRLVNDGYRGRNAMRITLTGTQSIIKENTGWEVAPGTGVITLAIRANHLTNIVPSATIDYYNSAGTLLGGSSTLTIPALVSTGVWLEFEQKVTIPANAATAKLRLGGAHTVAGTNTFDWSVVNWLLKAISTIALGLAAVTPPNLAAEAVTPPAIAAYAIKPASIDTGVLAQLYNGDMEIPNQANTLPDAWAATGVYTYLSSGAITGQRAMKFGGTSGTNNHTLITPFFLWTDSGARDWALRVRWLQTYTPPAAMTGTVKVRFFDAARTQVGTDQSLLTNAGATYTPDYSVPGSNVEVYLPRTSVPSGAVYASIVWTLQTTSSLALLTIDSVLVDNGSDTISAAGVQLRAAGLLVATESASGSDLDVNLTSSTGWWKQSGGKGLDLGAREFKADHVILNGTKISYGSTFPISPATDDEHHTGQKIWIWDGSRWVDEEKELAFFPRYLPPITPGTYTYADSPLQQNYAIKLIRWAFSFYVVTTNNGSNYWRATLLAVKSDGTRTSLGTIDTSNHGANNFFTNELTSFSPNPLTVGTYATLAVDITTVGTPGNIYPQPKILYRQVH